MNTSDPIADFLTRIRNASSAKKKFVDIPWSKQKERLATILKEKGLVSSILTNVNGTIGMIRVYLKYTQGRTSVIQGLKRVSKPGCRIYIGHEKIPYFYAGYGVPVISTSKGIMAGDEARQANCGGELLFLVW